MTESEIRAAIRARIAELDDERGRLAGALATLERAEPVAETAPEPERKRTRRSATPKIAPRGSRQRQVLDYVAKHPGARPAEIAAGAGMDLQVTHATLSVLARKGRVLKRSLDSRRVAYELPAPVTLNVQTVATPERELKDRRVAYVTSEG